MRQPHRQDAGQFGFLRGFVDIGSDHAMRGDADLGEQREAPWTRRGQDQLVPGHLNRKVIRPLDRS